MRRLEIDSIISATILKNGKIVEGTGTPPFSGEVVMAGGMIARVGSSKSRRPAESANVEYEVLDCTGCIIAPGFIDVHSHSDLQVLENGTEKLLQGVTAEIVGKCGFSAYAFPENPQVLRDLQMASHGG